MLLLTCPVAVAITMILLIWLDDFRGQIAIHAGITSAECFGEFQRDQIINRKVDDVLVGQKLPSRFRFLRTVPQVRFSMFFWPEQIAQAQGWRT